jgi:diaminohydroxyphosphoribosylaminopyrimidine deaminase/5-amino-6-(5-phosphoribosylamino)uracil reductase
MRRANDVAQYGLGLTFPNPIVGAVIVNAQGQEIAFGFHAGGDHAEVVAIRNAQALGQNDFSESSIFVTLEPCNHFGKTPPCSEALINAGFKNVFYSVADPNQEAAGGAERLRAAGINVITGLDAENTSYINRAWLHKVKHRRAYFVSKIAITLDGKIAAKDGSSKWITAEAARQSVAKLRYQSDAILTSTATVLADNPLLTPRLDSNDFPVKRGQNPERIVLGEREISADFQVRNSAAHTHLLQTHDFSRVVELSRDRGWNQILIEAGSTFNTALLKAGLIDELVIYMAPSLLGTGKSFVQDLGIETLSERMDFELGEVSKVGRDLKMQLFPKLGA